MQTAPVKKGTKIWHDNNNTAMGWALPASIAGGLVNPKSNTFCLVGDGSLMMNIQELATIKHLQLPIKIICFNNLGYSMIKQTQDNGSLLIMLRQTIIETWASQKLSMLLSLLD